MTESPFVREVKSVIQRVYEYIAVARREVSVREVLSAMPEVSRSTITFALTRLTRDEELRRIGRGRYVVTKEVPSLDPLGEDAFVFDLLERVRSSLTFSDLAFLYEIIEASRRLTPEVYRLARERSRRVSR